MANVLPEAMKASFEALLDRQMSKLTKESERICFVKTVVFTELGVTLPDSLIRQVLKAAKAAPIIERNLSLSAKWEEIKSSEPYCPRDLYDALGAVKNGEEAESEYSDLANYVLANASKLAGSTYEHLGQELAYICSIYPWSTFSISEEGGPKDLIEEWDEPAKKFADFFFFNETSVEIIPGSASIPADSIHGAGELVAALVTEGTEFDDALEAVCNEMAAYYSVLDGSSDGVETASALFSEYLTARTELQKIADHSTAWWFAARAKMIELGVPIFAPFEFAYLLGTRAGAELSKSISMIVSGLLLIFEKEGANPNIRTALGYALAGALDIIDQRHRLSPKPAWALLLAKTKPRLTRGDAMLASMHVSRYVPPSGYEEWATRMKDLMRGAAPDVDKLLVTPPTRGLFFPKNTYGIKSNEEYIDGFDVHIVETERERKRLADTIRFGAKQGIDGAWLATQERMTTSLSRYTVDRPSTSSIGKAKIIEAADALFDEFPEMYDAPRAMTVNSVINATEWKYSAGLPFLPIVKKRTTLRNTQWILAIKQAAQRILDSGEFPGVALHAFPKNQIVALDSAIGLDGPTKQIRTVTAGDRITAIAYNCLAMERNKRQPPTRALILPSFRRTEGGMQEVFRELAKQPNYFVGDASQFDSTVVSELAIEAPVHLWRRGIEGRYGERATTTFMQSYYQGLADGIIVSLYNGDVVRKTGGGGTGSAATTPDNRDWVRVALIASWSMVRHLPCSDFFKYVRLANASDDVAFSCDDTTAFLINEWRLCMLKEFGVSFSFEESRFADGILHLKITDKPDLEAYADLDISKPEYSVHHDPKRLFLMRSEYRADRMKMSFLTSHDVIVMQDIGHAYLTAHNREAYSEIATEWADSASSVAASIFSGVDVYKEFDQHGNCVSAALSVTDPAPAEMLVKRASKLHPERRAAYIEKRQQAMKRWLRSRRLPSYREVFQLWAKEPLPGSESAIAKRYRKLGVFDAPAPFIDVIRTGMEQVVALTSLYPKALKRLAGEEDVYLFTTRYTHSDFMIEKFVYWAMADRLGRVPQTPEMVAALRTSAYGAATDVWGFMVYASSDSGRLQLANAPSSEKAANYGRVLLSLVIYTFSDYGLRVLYKTRVLGTLVAALFIFLQDVDILYSFLSTWWWFVYGVNSLIISNLSVRDPYLVLKLFSITLAQSLPFPRHLPGQIWEHRTWLAYPLEVLVSAAKFKSAVPLSVATNMKVPDAPMASVVHSLEEQRFNNGNFSVIVAGMASGKSTIFPAALLKEGKFRRIILLMPTNVLVNDYQNAFLDPQTVHRITKEQPREDPLPKFGLVVMTAGLFSSRFSYGRLPQTRDHEELGYYLVSSDCVLLDEVSRCTPEQVCTLAMVRQSLQGGFYGLTGTPSGPLCAAAEGRTFHVAVHPRFTLERRDFEGDFQTTVNKALVTVKETGQRLMISVISEAEAVKLAKSISTSSLGSASVISRQVPFVPETGHVVATTIADFGVSIEPAPSYLVDEGYQLVRVPSNISISDANGHRKEVFTEWTLKEQTLRHLMLWSSPEICAQRHARVGRTSNGVVYAPQLAGTGPHFIPPMTIFRWAIKGAPLLRECLKIAAEGFDYEQLKPSPYFCGLLDIEKVRYDMRRTRLAYDIRVYMAFLALSSELGGIRPAHEALLSGDLDLFSEFCINLGVVIPTSFDQITDRSALTCICATYKGRVVTAPVYTYNVFDENFYIH